MKTVRGVLRPAFQMAVDDDVLYKNPFGFELAGVVVNDSVTREALTRDQMRKFLKFVHDDNAYCKYYEVVYILFHTGMRISEFCGLTIKDIDLGNRIVNIDHQLQWLSDMTLVFVLSRRKFYDLLNNTDGEDFLAYYGERKLILRVAFERYLCNHPELRRRV